MRSGNNARNIFDEIKNKIENNFPYDGIITKVFYKSVSVQPVGQIPPRIIQNVALPSHISSADVSPGMPCNLGTLNGKPIVTTVFRDMSVNNLQSTGIQPDILNKPVLSAIVTKDADDNPIYNVTININPDDTERISSIDIYYSYTNNYNNLIHYDTITPNTSSISILPTKPKQIYITAKVRSQTQSSQYADIVTASFKESNTIFYDDFNQYALNVLRAKGNAPQMLYFPMWDEYDNRIVIPYNQFNIDGGCQNVNVEFGVDYTSTSITTSPPAGSKIASIECNKNTSNTVEKFRIALIYYPAGNVDISHLFNESLQDSSGLLFDFFIRGHRSTQYSPPHHSVALAIENPTSPGNFVYLTDPVMISDGVYYDDRYRRVTTQSLTLDNLSPVVVTGNEPPYTGNNPNDFSSINEFRIIVEGENTSSSSQNIDMSINIWYAALSKYIAGEEYSSSYINNNDQTITNSSKPAYMLGEGNYRFLKQHTHNNVSNY